ncbi:unnamed protein product [Larinioides sclopetarius]|uniref:Uncharacterized protein n=1 Tax=Larinioides sclopetarius TaxID=280406 RepID=A0AAV2A3Q4_9ARAC
MNKFVILVLLCMLTTISCQECPPCSDVNGEMRYCVIDLYIHHARCMSGLRKGSRCHRKNENNGVYEKKPPCKEGLTCSNDKQRHPTSYPKTIGQAGNSVALESSRRNHHPTNFWELRGEGTR